MDEPKQQDALTPWTPFSGELIPPGPAERGHGNETRLALAPAPLPHGRIKLTRWILAGVLASSLMGAAALTGWKLRTWSVEYAVLRRDLAELRLREVEWQARQQRQAEALEELRMRLAEATSPTTPDSPVPSPGRHRSSNPSSLAANRPVKAGRLSASPVDQSGAGKERHEPPPRGKFKKFVTSSIFIDSAVLTSSLLVPPSIPLSLAQSRLGRRLTGRVLKKTHVDKTVGGRIVRDAGDMPITQRRRR